EIRGCWPVRRRQRIGIQPAPDPRAGLLGDPRQETWISDVFHEHSWNFFLTYLSDEFAHGTGRRFGFGRESFWRDEFDAVGIAEITKRTVGGADLAACRRNCRDRGFDFGIEAVELGAISGGIGLVVFFAGSIGGDKAVADILDIDLGIRDRLPGMRVARSMIVRA